MSATTAAATLTVIADTSRFHETVVLMCRVAGIATLVNVIELWRLRDCWADSGGRRMACVARGDGAGEGVLTAEYFPFVIATQLVASLLLVFAAASPLGALSALLLCTTTLLAAARFHGTVNGGSDAMLFTVLGGLVVAQLPDASPPLREAGVLYVAAQLTLSYVRAGVAKARHRDWWTGNALTLYCAMPAYGAPVWIQSALSAHPPLQRAVSVAVILFECAAPLAWFNTTLGAVYIAAAFGFHLAAAFVFGLNRFLWAWSAALPSLWYAVYRVSQPLS